MIVIQSLDQLGNRWFWNAKGYWQQKRDSECHFATAAGAGKAWKAANSIQRFASADDKMEEIEMVNLL